MQEFNPDPDLRKTREVDFGDNNKLLVKCTDPYGFWAIHYSKGETPSSLKGDYTSFDHAMKAITAYVARMPEVKRKDIKQIIT
jgi:hypothetical protein